MWKKKKSMNVLNSGENLLFSNMELSEKQKFWFPKIMKSGEMFSRKDYP